MELRPCFTMAMINSMLILKGLGVSGKGRSPFFPNLLRICFNIILILIVVIIVISIVIVIVLVIVTILIITIIKLTILTTEKLNIQVRTMLHIKNIGIKSQRFQIRGRYIIYMNYMRKRKT